MCIRDRYVGYPPSIADLVSGIEIQPEPRTLKYANCVLRRSERVEFRSCDRLETSQEILEMTCLRLLTLAAASEFKASQDEQHFRDLYIAACLDGSVCTKTVQKQLSRFKEVLSLEPERISQEFWGDCIATLLPKLERLSHHAVNLFER